MVNDDLTRIRERLYDMAGSLYWASESGANVDLRELCNAYDSSAPEPVTPDERRLFPAQITPMPLHCGISHRYLRVVLGQLQVLPVLFRAVVATCERQDQRVTALGLAQRADGAGMVGQRIIREGPTEDDVGTHGMTASPPAPRVRRGRCTCLFAVRTWLYPAGTCVPAGTRARRGSYPHFRLARKGVAHLCPGCDAGE